MIDMKPCENVEQFLEKVKDLSSDLNKPLLFNEINKDLESTFSHITSQK